jgi:A/G-specific adenine glycosylase
MTIFAADVTKQYDKCGLSKELINNFQNLIWDYYKDHIRSFPWRETDNPYHIFISEWMLQQTQTTAVISKYKAFLNRFPTFSDLAKSSVEDVIKLWQGLGYNRRAIWMKTAAEIIVREHGGVLPDDPEILEKIKGIGHATAREMVSFAYNKPTAFIETNIRRVFLHLFFYNKTGIRDADILELVKKTVDNENPREWYYALMDYGVYLKKNLKPDPNHRSAHYKKQPKFKGSDRELRGKILRMKIANTSITIDELAQKLQQPVRKVKEFITKMEQEGFFKK